MCVQSIDEVPGASSLMAMRAVPLLCPFSHEERIFRMRKWLPGLHRDDKTKVEKAFDPYELSCIPLKVNLPPMNPRETRTSSHCGSQRGQCCFSQPPLRAGGHMSWSWSKRHNNPRLGMQCPQPWRLQHRPVPHLTCATLLRVLNLILQPFWRLCEPPLSSQ